MVHVRSVCTFANYVYWCFCGLSSWSHFPELEDHMVDDYYGLEHNVLIIKLSEAEISFLYFGYPMAQWL